MKTLHTISFNVSAKKGDNQPTRWLVVQNHPHPRINANCGALRWENDEGQLWSSYQRPATGLADNFTCYLLADTCPDPVPEDYNRSQFAGFVPYASYGKPALPPNGGVIQFRGASLGECIVRFEREWTRISVRDGSQSPSKSESDFFNDQIIPHLKAFIAANRESLKAEAVTRVKARLAGEVAEKRKELNNLEKAIKTAKL